MLEQILSGKELDFNKLEKEIFKIGCAYARQIMVDLLESLDDDIGKSRDRKEYRHKGKRKNTLKTLMGEIEYERAIYEKKNEDGEKTYVYLLDNAMKLETFGKISTNLAFKVAENACISSYRNAAKNITDMTGQSISHGGVWQVVQSLGTKIKETEETYAEMAEQGEEMGQKETKILFEEADGVWLNMQGKDRPKRGKKVEMKVAVAYDGWEKVSKNRYELRNKVAVIGMEKSKVFQRRKEGVIASVFHRDEIDLRILNGDGARWIKSGIIDDSVHYQLDPFHLNREIFRKIKNKEQRQGLFRILSEKRVDDALLYLKGILEIETEEKEKENLKGLYRYLCNNKEGLIPYKDRGLEIPIAPEGVEYRQLGTMEHHVCDIIAHRMKHRKASWSISGAENLGKILTQKVCKTLYEKVTNLSKVMLPERYAKEICEVMTAAKSPIKIGKGYKYPKTTNTPFEGAFMTNGREAIRNMVKERVATALVYR